MTNEELVAIIKSHRANSLGAEDGDLSDERAQALDHYHGRPYGNEVDGRSQVVSRDLMEAVDWAMPSLLRMFTLAGRLAEFSPVGPEDEQLADQESDYVNQVLMKDNPGFLILHDVFKDTLLLKNGYVKHWWDVEEQTEETSYSGLTMDQITLMMRELEEYGSKVEILGQESRFIEIPGMPQQMNAAQQIQTPPMMEVFDIKLKVTKKCGKLVWMAVPTEEVRVSKKCRGSLQESPFTEHVTRKTRSDLIEMGIPRSFVDNLASVNDSDTGQQRIARDSVDDESDGMAQSAADRSMDEIEFCEAYLKVDWDGDGVAELRKVVTCADQIPDGDDWNEPIPAVPMTGYVAKRVPHRHVGESLDDELKDLQEIMTVLKRQLLDNLYLNNASELVVNENANLRDFMTRLPGGIKRIRGTDPVGNAVMPLQTMPIIDKILPVVQFFDEAKQKRSGIDGANTGVDPDILQQTTKGAFLENLNRAGQKIEMIGRLLAESGVKETVLQAHAILMRHQDQERIVQMRGKWIPVNPQEWKRRTDLSVKVGLGTGNEDDKRTKLGMLQAIQGQLMQALVGAPPPVYAKMYALFEDMAKTLGAETPEKYAVAPNSPEYEQLQQMLQQQKQQANQQGDMAAAAQIQAQADMQIQQAKLQSQMQIKAAEDQFKREKEAFMARFEAMDRDAQRRHELVMQQAELRSKESVEAMKAEVQAWIKGLQFDLGQPGLSAGVQGAPGMPAPMGQETGVIEENGPEEGQGMQE